MNTLEKLRRLSRALSAVRRLGVEPWDKNPPEKALEALQEWRSALGATALIPTEHLLVALESARDSEYEALRKVVESVRSGQGR